MRVRLIAAGTRLPDWVNEGYAGYARRLVGFRLELVEVSVPQRMQKLIDPRDYVVALEVTGRAMTTVELARWLAKTGHANRFVLLGERADVPICLAAMDIFCLSSRTEGFPNVVGEAMAMGLPCVVTDVGDAAMLVADAGLVVPKENSVALAQGLSRVLRMTPAARQQLGQQAKARIQAEFTMERARERFEELYEQVIERDGR